MKAVLLAIVVLFAQARDLQDLQGKPVVRLEPGHRSVDVTLGGKVLELINAEPKIQMPLPVPETDIDGRPWLVDIKNLGPHPVEVVGTPHFSVLIKMGQTVHILSSDGRYVLTR